MKYVSCCCASEAADECITPLRPPMMNSQMNPTAKSMAVLKSIEPRHIVAIQLNILTPVGTAIAMVVRAKTEFATGPSPTVNMWWLQTIHPMKAMTSPDSTTTG